MPTSEIDDIFAKKGKIQLALVDNVASTEKKKKKKKKKKTPDTTDRQQQQQEPPGPSVPKKRPAPETIVDSSVPAKKTKTSNSSRNKAEKDSHFHDSRGTGSRKKTEEGWSVYKEDELGINNAGGDTELCPFDCNCCF